MTTKKCTSCKEEKPTSEFYVRKDRNTFVSACKTCTIKNNFTYRDKEHQKAYKADYHKNNLPRKLRNDLKKYGLTFDQYNQMLDRQNKCCAMCKLPPSANKRLSIDHCHSTGKVRGLLCSNCNFILGLAKDSPAVLKNGAYYLEKYENYIEET
jgi:hypothetical protein